MRGTYHVTRTVGMLALVSTDQESLDDIEARVAAALADLGEQGRVYVDQGVLHLVDQGKSVQIAITTELMHWPAWTPAQRQRRAASLADHLVEQRGGRVRKRLPWILSAILLLGLCVGGWFGSLWWRERQANAAVSPSALVSRAERARQVCRRTAERVGRGDTLGPSDDEGWVVALLLVGQLPQDSAALLPFVRDGQVVAEAAPALSAAKSSSTRVDLRRFALGEEQALELVFTGRYVRPWFEPSLRQQYLALSRQLSAALKAPRAALFAHCEGDPTPQVGAWFFGSSPARASAMLVATLAGKALPRLLSGEPGAGPGFAQQLTGLEQQFSDLTRDSLRVRLHDTGAGVQALDGEATALHFTLREANRGRRAAARLLSDTRDR